MLGMRMRRELAGKEGMICQRGSSQQGWRGAINKDEARDHEDRTRRRGEREEEG